MSQQQTLREVVALTSQIEHAASLEDWKEVARLTALRTPKLETLSKTDDAGALAVLRGIMKTNADVMASATTARVELQAEFQGILKRASNVTAYNRVALMR